MRLEGKTAIVTGASNGMGSSESKLFAKEGANVVLADVDSESGQRLVEEISEGGGQAHFEMCDVSSEDNWQAMSDNVLSKYGSVDILVNNAGISSTSTSDLLSTDAWNNIMEVNSTGVFLGTKTAAEIMKSQGGGSIVNISSIMGFVGGEYGHPAYHASKGSVRIFSKAMAVRYGPYGVRVNTVHPGFMPPMTSSDHGAASKRDEYVAQTPLRHPDDVARTVLFLASDEASFVTGTELVIDGGYIAQ